MKISRLKCLAIVVFTWFGICGCAMIATGAPKHATLPPIVSYLLNDPPPVSDPVWLGTFHTQAEVDFWARRIKGSYFREYDDHPLINGNHSSVNTISNNAAVFLGEAGGGWETFLWVYPYPYKPDGVPHYNAFFDSTTVVDSDRQSYIGSLDDFTANYEPNLAIEVPNGAQEPFSATQCNGTILIKNGESWKVSMPANSPHAHDWKAVRDAAFLSMLGKTDRQFAQRFFNKELTAVRRGFEGIGPAGEFTNLSIPSVTDSINLVKQFLVTQFQSRFNLDVEQQSNIWCAQTPRSRAHTAPFFTYANGFTELLFAYEYVRESFDHRERERMKSLILAGSQRWGEKVVDYIEYHMPNLFIDGHPRQFVNRQDASSNQPATSLRYLNDEEEVFEISKFFNNRVLASARYALLGAIHLTEMHKRLPGYYQLTDLQVTQMQTVRENMRAFAKAAVAFQIDPDDGVVAELVRGNQDARAGMIYISTTIGTLVTMADALARAGDTSLYDFRDDAGAGATKGPAGIEDALNWMVGVMTGELHYRNLTNQRFTDVRGIDADVIAAARYYGRQGNLKLRDALYRLVSSEVPKLGQLDPSEVGGEWGIFVDSYFMFLDIDNNIQIYPH